MQRAAGFLGGCIVLFAGLATTGVGAQSYPVKPVRIVIGYPLGGGSEFTARPIAARLSERWGQSVVVDPRPGASGMIATELVVKSGPDGYTLLVAASSEVALNVALFPKITYDPVRQLAPISHISISPPIIITHPSFPVKSVQELIAFARKRPGQITFASPGLGSPQHFAGELMKLETKIDMVHVPYKGAGPALVDLIGGHVPVGLIAIVVALPHVTSGRLRALAVTTARRPEVLPDVPTVADTLPGFDVGQWFSIWAPANTPADIIQKLNAETIAIVQSAQYRALMRDAGTEVVGSSPEVLRKLQVTEIERYVRIAREANIKPN